MEENTVCHWIKLTADELEPLYRLKHDDLLKEPVLHADGTSFRCPKRDKTDTNIQAIAPVRGGALYLWGANRSAGNLDRMLRQGMQESGPSYSGAIVTDGWASYDAWIKKRDEEHKAASGNPGHPATKRAGHTRGASLWKGAKEAETRSGAGKSLNSSPRSTRWKTNRGKATPHRKKYWSDGKGKPSPM